MSKYVGWWRIWINAKAVDTLGSIDEQIEAVNQVIGSQILAPEITKNLRDVVYTLAIVKSGEADGSEERFHNIREFVNRYFPNARTCPHCEGTGIDRKDNPYLSSTAGCPFCHKPFVVVENGVTCGCTNIR